MAKSWECEQMADELQVAILYLQVRTVGWMPSLDCTGRRSHWEVILS